MINLMVVVALACVVAGCRTGDVLSLWTDGAASRRVIEEYVAAVTDNDRERMTAEAYKGVSIEELKVMIRVA